MVQAMIDIEEKTNRVLNIVKAKHGLKDKSEAINLVVSAYEENFLEPELKPEFVKKIQHLEKKGKFTKFSSIDDLRKKIDHHDSIYKRKT
jgi:hypothetical protein